jgi:streptomycin 6-kinase
MKALWKEPPEGNGFPTVGEWFSGLSRVRSRFDGETGPFPPRLFERAEALSHEMLDSAPVGMLLHGDCHHHNILSSSGRGWLAVDPKGVVGDPVFELCAYLRNPLDLHERFDVAKTLPGRVHLFAEILGLEPRRIASWGLAESILSAGWSLDGDPAFVRKSVELAELYGKMLRERTI